MTTPESVRRIVGGMGAQTQYAPRSYEAAMADLDRPAPPTTGAAAGAMSDERLAEIRHNLIEKGWRPTREETLTLMSEVDRLRSSSRSSA
jgi:hypothetical protein